MNTNRIENNKQKLLLFFNGWGCDEHQFNHIKTHEYDVLMLNKYHNLDVSSEDLEAIKKYDQVDVIAWSYGVWVAHYVCCKYELNITKAVAVNGTLEPVSDQFGISLAITQGTLKNLNERNLMKFQRRMVGGNEAWKKFEADKPQRDFDEQRDELKALIEHFSIPLSEKPFYHKAIVGLNDLIFISENQKVYWNNKVETTEIDAPHFCFYNFNSWEEMIYSN